MPLSTAEPFIRLVNISKRFPGVIAVDDVNLDMYPGEVHVVAGENSVKVMVNQLRNNVKATIEDPGVIFISPSNINSPQIQAALTPTCANQSI